MRLMQTQVVQPLSFMTWRLTFRCNMSQEIFHMKAAFLPDRGVVKVNGDGARDFLNGLVTSDVTLLRPGSAVSGPC
jgi:Predicted aminomethyltransferase related to GcvT